MFASMEIFAPRFCIGVFWKSGRIVSLCGPSIISHPTVSIRDSQRLVSMGYWPIDSFEDVNVLESKALLSAVVTFRS